MPADLVFLCELCGKAFELDFELDF